MTNQRDQILRLYLQIFGTEHLKNDWLNMMMKYLDLFLTGENLSD